MLKWTFVILIKYKCDDVWHGCDVLKTCPEYAQNFLCQVTWFLDLLGRFWSVMEAEERGWTPRARITPDEIASNSNSEPHLV